MIHANKILACVVFESSLIGAALAVDAQVLSLSKRIELPDVQGRLGHMAFDPATRALFVAAEDNNSIEVIDLANGKRSVSIKNVRSPRGIAQAEDGALYISSGAGSCEIIDGRSLKPLAAISLGSDVDKIRYYFESRLMYVGFGRSIGVIDIVKRAKTAEIPLKGHPESFAL